MLSDSPDLLFNGTSVSSTLERGQSCCRLDSSFDIGIAGSKLLKCSFHVFSFLSCSYLFDYTNLLTGPEK